MVMSKGGIWKGKGREYRLGGGGEGGGGGGGGDWVHSGQGVLNEEITKTPLLLAVSDLVNRASGHLG